MLRATATGEASKEPAPIELLLDRQGRRPGRNSAPETVGRGPNSPTWPPAEPIRPHPCEGLQDKASASVQGDAPRTLLAADGGAEASRRPEGAKMQTSEAGTASELRPRIALAGQLASDRGRVISRPTHHLPRRFPASSCERDAQRVTCCRRDKPSSPTLTLHLRHRQHQSALRRPRNITVRLSSHRREHKPRVHTFGLLKEIRRLLKPRTRSVEKLPHDRRLRSATSTSKTPQNHVHFRLKSDKEAPFQS